MIHTAEATDASIAVLFEHLDAGQPIVLVDPRLAAPERARIEALAVPEVLRGVAVGLATSGTTGAPKLVLHGAAGLAAAVASSNAALGARTDDRSLLCLPWSGAGGLAVLLRARAAGAHVVIAPLGERAAVLRERMIAHAVTLASVVPAQLAGLVDAGAPPLSLRAVVVGGDATRPALLARARAAGWPVRTTYGMTETAGMVALSDDAGALRLLLGVAVEVEDPDDDGTGRLRVRAPGAAVSVIGGEGPDARGFLCTADLGRVEGEILCVLGRTDDVIIVGGAKVAPSEVEAALVATGLVDDALVFGHDDARQGATVAALLVAGARGPVPTDELTRALATVLAPWKRPRAIAWVPALPLTPAGKRDRAAARAIALSPL